MKQTLLAAALSLALSTALLSAAPAQAAPRAAAAANAADQRFDAIWQAEWKWRLDQGLAWDEDSPRALRGELARVAPAAADDGAVGARRGAGRPVEPEPLQPGMGLGVEEAAMGRGDQRQAVQRSRQGERVEEEVDRVDVDDVGALERDAAAQARIAIDDQQAAMGRGPSAVRGGRRQRPHRARRAATHPGQ